MGSEPAADYKKYRWFWFVLMLGLGILLIFVTSVMYLEAAKEDKIGSTGQIITMKITGRERGAGTLKFPDHIYARYHGVQHDFTCGRKFCRKMMAADSIEVRLDLASGRAVLPGSGRFRHQAFLFVMIIGVAVAVIWKSIREFNKYG